MHKVFNDAAAQGLNVHSTKDSGNSFLQQIERNNGVFAAFKTHRFQNDVARQLLDEEGKLKSFEQFRTDTRSIVSHHKDAWLRTEYDTAVKRARKASEMRRFMDEADVLPNLRWLSSTAITPREEHKPFYDRVWSIDALFWEEHRPGDEWGCQCDWEATDDPVTDNRDIDPTAGAPSPGLGGDPARTGRLFSDDHPYFPKSCSACPFNNVPLKVFRNKAKDCYACANVVNAQKNAVLKSGLIEYKRLKLDPDYINVKYDKKSGGVKATHVGHIVHDGKKEQLFFGKLTSSDLENECVDQLFKRGHKVILCDESAKNANGDPYPALDIILDGRVMDIASITKLKDSYVSQISRKNKQIVKYNSRPDITQKASAVCLYFHDPGMYSLDRIKKGILELKTYKKSDGSPIDIHIKQVYCVVNGFDKIEIANI